MLTMARLDLPDVEDGPLHNLLVELHQLHARAGWPSVRAMAGHLGMATMTVHSIFVSPKLPSLPSLLRMAEHLAGLDPRKPSPDKIQDRIDNLWTAASRSSDLAILQPSAVYGREPFVLGPLKTSLLIIEGDGEIPFTERDVKTIDSKQWVDVPPEVREWKAELEAVVDAFEESGREPPFWNGDCYAIDYVDVSREPNFEHGRITIGLQWSDYFTFRAAQQLDRPMQDGKSLRQKYLDGQHWSTVPPFISSSFGTNVAVSTADGMVLFSKRSGKVGVRPDVWNSSANEGLSRGQDSDGSHSPSIFRAARRGLEEELALADEEEYDLQLLAITLDTNLHHWGCVFWAKLRTLTSSQWIERASRGVRDKFEHDEFTFVPFTPTDVFEKLLEIDEKSAWAPTVPALYFLTLVRRWGRREVEEAAARIF